MANLVDNIQNKNKTFLKQQLEALGFSKRLATALDFYFKYPQRNFLLLERERQTNEKSVYKLFFEQQHRTGEFKLAEVEASLRIAPEIPELFNGRVSTKKLDEQMSKIDWSIDHHSETLIYDKVSNKEGRRELADIDKILRKIDQLYDGSFREKDAAEKLMYKHWFGEPWEPNTISLNHLQNKYEWTSNTIINASTFKTKSDIYKELKTIAQSDLEKLSNTYSFTTKTNFMNEKNYEYLTEQLKRTGFGDTLNEDMRKNIEKQNAEFTLNMQKEYGTDKVSATLHFKKSPESDMFFFNKYDLELKKENQDNAMKQTFYPDKGITLKEGYNMLDGRAVHKTLTTKEDEKYTAWLQLDFKNTTESGNYKINQYHQNYGFNLENALSKYPIKELGNEKFKADLMKSLERGNLQSATLNVNGKEQKIYLTANPNFKSLTAFDAGLNKIKLSDVIQNQKQEQSNKQDNKQTMTEKQGAKKDFKVCTEKNIPAQKKSKKQKIA